MSDDFHRPTLTFPYDAYNATQVRLYGIQAKGGLSFSGHPTTLADTGVSVHFSGNGTEDVNDDTRRGVEILRSLKGQSLASIVHGIVSGLIDWNIPTKLAYQLRIDMKAFGTIVVSTSVSLGEFGKNGPLSAGIIVGYSYEGHCYDLPKPKIMLIRALPIKIPVDDCGYNLKSREGYKLWIVDKLDQCVEFEMNQGFVEQLVLEANLPGKRSPTMYVGRMMLAHRSGRLSE